MLVFNTVGIKWCNTQTHGHTHTSDTVVSSSQAKSVWSLSVCLIQESFQNIAAVKEENESEKFRRDFMSHMKSDGCDKHQVRMWLKMKTNHQMWTLNSMIWFRRVWRFMHRHLLFIQSTRHSLQTQFHDRQFVHIWIRINLYNHSSTFLYDLLTLGLGVGFHYRFYFL